MTFCIEPMINAGGGSVATLPDDWTIVTAGRQPRRRISSTRLP